MGTLKTGLLGILVVASFMIAVVPNTLLPSAEFSFHHAGAVWFEGNATRVYLDVNTSVPVSVRARLYREKTPETFFLWNESSDASFPDFSESLQKKLLSANASFQATRTVPKTAGSFLALFGHLPSNFPLQSFLESGGVLLYAGPPIRARNFTLEMDDELNGEYTLTFGNATSVLKKGWKILDVFSGKLVYRTRNLEQSWKNAHEASSAVAHAYLEALWMDPLAETTGEWNATSRLWMLPLPVFQAFGVVTLQSHEITKRYPFFVRTPEQRVFTSSKLFWPQSSLFSALNVSGPLVLFADTKTGFITVGNFSPNQRAVFSSFPTTLLDEGLFRIVVRDIRGHVFSESFLDVRKANVIPLKIDSTSKTFLAAFSEAKRPLSGVTIRWQNQTRLTSADGVAKFSGFFNASVPFVYDTIDLFADAETFENAGQLSVYSMLAAILILIGAWIFARFRGKTFVVFRPPASHLRKKIPLDRAALEKLLGGHCQSFDQLRKKLCEKDPYLHVDPVSLQTALDDLVRSKRLNKKKEVYCL